MIRDTGKSMILAVLLCIVVISSAVPAMAATTEVSITKYASDDTTILNETRVNYTWMEANLAVQGNGATEYSHQGPIFEGDRWDPDETLNLKSKGLVKGTDVRDLCELVGGMSPSDEIKIIASDGFSERFGYENVYLPQSRQGPMVVCWYKDGDHVPDYGDGLQLAFFANDTVFGNWDMHESMAPEYRYNYSSIYPSSNGLSVKYIDTIEIYSAIEAVFDGAVTLTEGNFTLTAYDSGVDYEVKQLTPMGALDAAATAGGFEYNVTDKKFADKGILMLDDIGEYIYNNVNDTVKWAWSCSVNDHVLDDWNSPGTEGLNVYELQDNDVVYYFYGNVNLPDYGAEDAIAVINITANAGTGVDVIFDGTVVLEGGNFTWYDKDGNSHEVANFTPHGALEVAAHDDAFDYNGSWKDSKNTALIDWIEEYEYNDSVTPKLTWNYQLNGVYQDYYSDTTGVSNNPITDGDYIEFYYGPNQETTENATAVVRITVNPEPGDWNLTMTGSTTEVISKSEFEGGVSCGHYANWTDPDTGEFWEGIPLWLLVGWADDGTQHGPDAFNDALAAEGYSVKVIAGDGWSTSLDSADIAQNDGYIVADTLNGTHLSKDGSHPPWPLRLVGSEVSGGSSVGNIVEIELTEFGGQQESPSVHVILYDAYGTTVLNETNVTYQWMEANLPIIGDGTTAYRFEACDFTGDHWDQAETYPGGFKVDRVVKGTSVKDLCELVGGMTEGTEIRLVASDGYETKLGYANIYTGELSSEQQERQGEAFLAWWADDEGYMPDYSNGMRLFFTANDSDHIFGNWDMHECLPELCYHFYELYPSTNGFTVKWVDEFRVYSGGYTGDEGGPAKSMPESTSSSVPGFGVIPAIAGLLLVAYTLRRRIR